MPTKNNPALTICVSVHLFNTISFLWILLAIHSAYFHSTTPPIIGKRTVADKTISNSGVNRLFIFPEKTTGKNEYNVVKAKYKARTFISNIENDFIKSLNT